MNKTIFSLVSAVLFFLLSIAFLLFSIDLYNLTMKNDTQTVLSGSLGAKLSLQEKTGSYQPPMNCTISFSGFGETAYLDVRGLNSTLFCRRVVSAFSNDHNFVALDVNVTNIPEKQRPLCRIMGDKFTINIFSEQSLGGYICNNWSQQL